MAVYARSHTHETYSARRQRAERKAVGAILGTLVRTV